VKKILLLTANPKNTEKRRLDEEIREIQESLQRSRCRNKFEIIPKQAIRPDDLQRALLDCEPQIVHFSGHGAGSKGLVLENDDGQMKFVSAESLARLFKLFKHQVECVLLNACYSEIQAKAIHQHIDHVVGMDQAIGDQAAIKFAVGFYDALGADRDYADAFEFGLAAIDLEGISETATPKLKRRSPSSSPIPEILKVAHQFAPVLKPIPQNSEQEIRSRIFISYKHGHAFSQDEEVVMAVFDALREHHDVFIDQAILVGTPWAKSIETELEEADFFISFLTEQSVSSEMVKGEIEKAYYLGKHKGKPLILPVRLAYQEPFGYPLSVYLNSLNWAFWDSSADTSRLVRELQQAIAGHDFATDSSNRNRKLTSVYPQSRSVIPQPHPYAQPVVSLESAEGTMDSESRFYVERDKDMIALSTIQRKGVTITIKGPRQMGKSSLLMKVIDTAIKAGKTVVFLDFQMFDP
jgi:TIR domain/AAA-like domain/CHAT domain